MYPVSEAFLQAVQENTRRYYWTGRITTVKGAVYEFGPNEIVKGVGIFPVSAVAMLRLNLAQCMQLRWGLRFCRVSTDTHWRMLWWSCFII